MSKVTDLRVYVTKRLSAGSCNFCTRSSKGMPQDEVLIIEGNNTNVRICADCLEDLKKKLEIVEITGEPKNHYN